MSKRFRREEENLLMLEQFWSDLAAAFETVKARNPNAPTLAAIAALIDKYLRFVSDRDVGVRTPIPEWPEAFRAQQLIAGLMTPDEAKPELTRQLAELKKVDEASFLAFDAERAAISTGGAALYPQLLAAVQRQVNWKNSQRWLIRSLGTLYARRLWGAFVTAVLIGAVLVGVDVATWPGGVPVNGVDVAAFFQNGALSGLGFALAAGLLGATFSAMTGQNSVKALDNIEEASAATSRSMVTLRLGVGVAAALILYFFFQAQLIDGALFPQLAEIGFAGVQPAPADVDSMLALVSQSGMSGQKLINALGALARAETVDRAAAEDLHEVVAAFRASVETGRDAWRPGLGRYVPNADLAKLVVWCFAAGFVQTLVPKLLATVGATGEAAKGAKS